MVLKPSAPVIPPTKLELLHNIVSKHGSNEAFLANRTVRIATLPLLLPEHFNVPYSEVPV